MKGIKSLLAIVAGLVIGTAVQARTLDQIKADGKIIVATEGAYPPFNYYQADKLSGFEVDLAEAIAKKKKSGLWSFPDLPHPNIVILNALKGRTPPP